MATKIMFLFDLATILATKFLFLWIISKNKANLYMKEEVGLYLICCNYILFPS